jgi:hypothetical protein
MQLVMELNSGFDTDQHVQSTAKSYSHYTAPVITFPYDFYTALSLMLFSYW